MVYVMYKVRIKFEKKDKMIYIGHLDLLKIFQRSIKRAKLPIKYSEGFNPHQEVVFALPLPLGFTTKADYVDIKLTTDMDTNEIKERLNNSTPNGLNIIDVKKIENEKNCASILGYGIYHIEGIVYTEEEINSFLDQEEIIITKKTKKGKLKEENIKDKIKEIKVENNVLNIFIKIGSNGNLKPDLLMEKLNEFLNKEETLLKYTRIEMFKENGEKLI